MNTTTNNLIFYLKSSSTTQIENLYPPGSLFHMVRIVYILEGQQNL